MPILAKYRHQYRCFNDDIQGTGCVTLAGVLASARQAGLALTEMSFMCAGAGSAGLGVCAQIVDGMVEAGLSRDEAMERFVVCTSVGAIGRADGTHGDPNAKRGLSEERTLWKNEAVADGTPMVDVVRQFKPTCLLGLAAQPGGLFTEEMVASMVEYTDSPIVMPMSNPTAKAECTPAQAYEWTGGKAVVATGSPFEPVTMPDGRTLIPSQCNNMYVFPVRLAVGPGARRHRPVGMRGRGVGRRAPEVGGWGSGAPFLSPSAAHRPLPLRRPSPSPPPPPIALSPSATHP